MDLEKKLKEQAMNNYDFKSVSFSDLLKSLKDDNK